MNVMQAGELLARIQVHDNRKVDELTIEEWHHDLADVDFADALAAVRAHRRLPDPVYLSIGHVLAGVKRIRDARTAGVDHCQPPDADPDDVPAYLAALRAGYRRTAAGEVKRPMPRLDRLTKRPRELE